MKTITIRIDESWDQIIDDNAIKMWQNGASNIYPDKAERERNGFVNQKTSQVCEAALFYYFDGHIDRYVRFRDAKNKNPHKGDGGRDVPWVDFDIKGTLYRYPNLKPYQYTLIVRPNEFHQNWIYALGLSSIDYRWASLVGWTHSENMKLPGNNIKFPECYTLEGYQLFEFFPLQVMSGIWGIS